MAQKYITVKTSDLSGAELADGAGQTLTFSVGRSDYVIDLADDEVAGFFDVLKPYIDAARKDETPVKQRPKAAEPRPNLSKVREWAAANGFSVSSRGRVPAAVLEAYSVAN